MGKTALIITDVQNDFCPGGALAVNDGDAVVPVINAISRCFDKVVATQDWHPAGHMSFASTHNKHVGDIITVDRLDQILWPDHCVQMSRGADFHRDLDLSPVDIIIRKGANSAMDSYSTFYENDKQTSTGLEYYLRGMHITDVYLCGLATDYCVFYSAFDALHLDFNTFVILDASRGVDIPENNLRKSIELMRENNIILINHTDISGD